MAMLHLSGKKPTKEASKGFLKPFKPVFLGGGGWGGALETSLVFGLHW